MRRLVGRHLTLVTPASDVERARAIEVALKARIASVCASCGVDRAIYADWIERAIAAHRVSGPGDVVPAVAAALAAVLPPGPASVEKAIVVGIALALAFDGA